MERTRGSRAGGGARVIDPDRQTHQRGFSHGCLDPAREHHDTRAGLGACAVARARDVRERTGNRDQYAGGCERGFAFTAPDIECCPRSADDRQKAGAEATFGRRAGSACAGSAGLGDRQRMTLSKAVADR